jgi:glutamine amidotransferase-like uncharacterized protein
MVAARNFFGERARFDLVFRGFIAVFLLFSASPATDSRAEDPAPASLPVAVVYNGKGACREQCASAIARIARKAGLQVRYVNHKTLSSATLQGAAMYIQPGGDALEVLDAVKPEQLQAIRDFILSGGRYLGICAGAFLADTYVDTENTRLGLGILPGETIDYFPVQPMPKELIVETHWTEGLLPGIQGSRQVYFSDGAGFVLSKPAPTLEVLSTYADGVPSTVRFVHGHGKVAITGVHPEAPKKWWKPNEDRTLPLQDPDGEDHDIALALIHWLIQD